SAIDEVLVRDIEKIVVFVPSNRRSGAEQPPIIEICESAVDQVGPVVTGRARENADPRHQEPDMCLHHDFQTNQSDKDPLAKGGHILAMWPGTERKKTSEKRPHRPARGRCEDHCTTGKYR